VAFGDEDVPALLQDMGETVTLGSASTLGHIDVVDARLLEGFDGEDAAAIVGADITALIQTESLAGLVPGSSVTVRSTTYKVIRTLRVGNGALTLVALQLP
jgi:hypothetical protein